MVPNLSTNLANRIYHNQVGRKKKKTTHYWHVLEGKCYGDIEVLPGGRGLGMNRIKQIPRGQPSGGKWLDLDFLTCERRETSGGGQN